MNLIPRQYIEICLDRQCRVQNKVITNFQEQAQHFSHGNRRLLVDIVKDLNKNQEIIQHWNDLDSKLGQVDNLIHKFKKSINISCDSILRDINVDYLRHKRQQDIINHFLQDDLDALQDLQGELTFLINQEALLEESKQILRHFDKKIIDIDHHMSQAIQKLEINSINSNKNDFQDKLIVKVHSQRKSTGSMFDWPLIPVLIIFMISLNSLLTKEGNQFTMRRVMDCLSNKSVLQIDDNGNIENLCNDNINKNHTDAFYQRGKYKYGKNKCSLLFTQTKYDKEFRNKRKLNGQSYEGYEGVIIENNQTQEKYTWLNGDIYLGQFNNGQFHGLGQFNQSTGIIYEGEWVNGKQQGKGKCTWPNKDMYQGDWSNDKQHGNGILTYSSGAIYVGEWVNDKQQGQGKFTWPNGNMYEGAFENNKKTGKGNFTWPSGDSYEGDWIDDKQNGIGKYIWPNGDIYEGQWVNHRQHGEGKKSWPDGRVYQGGFDNDKQHGKGKYSWPNAESYEGDWLDNKRHGKGQYRLSNGKTFDGAWVHDQLQ